MSRRDYRQSRRAGATPPALQVPQTIAGLVAWYRADLGVTIATGVSQWNDQSGTGDANKNALQGTAGLQPAFNASNASYNNQATITFGTNQLLQTGNWSVALAQTYTVFFVGHTTSGATNTVPYDCNAGNQIEMFESGGTGIQIFAGATLASGVTMVNTPSIIYAVYNSVSSKIGVRAKTPTVTGDAGTNGATGLTLGCSKIGNASLIGPMAELAVYSHGLTAPEIAAFAGYAATRYGLAEGA